MESENAIFLTIKKLNGTNIDLCNPAEAWKFSTFEFFCFPPAAQPIEYFLGSQVLKFLSKTSGKADPPPPKVQELAILPYLPYLPRKVEN